MSQNGLICDDIGWWIRFDKGSDGINDINDIVVGLGDIMEGKCTKNKFASSHGEPSGAFIIIVDVWSMPYAT